MKKTFSKNQKVIKVGNSYAITLDKEFVDKTGIEPGDNIETIYDPQSKKAALVVRDKGSASYSLTTNKISEEFKKWVDESLEEDKEMLEILSKI
ncbi:MAG TPA: AbrB/MazE/SpoVT family DNA-binding domain-containing protein [Patescibacteria group bacterium]